MTFERSPIPPEHAQPPAASDTAGSTSPSSGPTPVQIRLQILSTEHWSLLASRSLAWNEAFSRASMYLSTLSASIVALGLIGGIDHFSDAFFAFAFVILPIDVFVGVGAWIRIAASNYHDARTVLGMNRIRGAYLEIAPDLEKYFVMGTHDDPRGIAITMALPPRMPALLHLVSSTPFLLVTLNAVVAGSVGALLLVRFGAGAAVVVAGALAVAVTVYGLELTVARRNIRIVWRSFQPLFPTPDDAPADPVASRLL